MNRFPAPDDCASNDCASNDCASLAPFLTELFDGAADAQAAARARAHLLSCQQCARLWLDWNQHRNILRNDRVPAPPPTLLWRVLVATRVVAHARPQGRPQRRHQSASLAAPLHQLEAPLPPGLSAPILARTTRKPSVSPLFGAPILTPNVAQFAARPPQTARFSRAARWGRLPLVAAPALALLLLMLGRADFNAPLTAPTAPQKALAPQINEASAPAKTAPLGARALEAQVPSGIASPVPARPSPLNVSGALSFPTVRASVPAASGRNLRVQRVGAQRVAALRADADLSQMIVLAFDSAQDSRVQTFESSVASNARGARVAGDARVAAGRARGSRVAGSRAMGSTFEFEPRHLVSVSRAAARPSAHARLELAAPPARLRVITTSTARLRAASFSGQPNAPHSRVALGSAATSARRGAPDDDANLRVSRPAPLAPAVRLASLNTGEPNGPRIEDLRSAVDEFRASISDNSAGEGWDG